MKAVVFDMDGVIFDSETLVLACWEEVAKRYGVKDVKKVCLECLGINAKATTELFKKHYGKDFPYTEYKQEVSQKFHEIVKGGGLKKMPGVDKLLAFLKENDYRIGLASSTRREVVEAELTQAGLISFFDTIVCGDMVTKSKPDPEIFLMACEQLNVLPKEAFGIEDSYNGIRACHAAGMKTIMIPDKLPPTEEMKELSDVIFNSLEEVIGYIIENTNLC